MWRISAVAEDWVDNGCHIHIDRVELAVRPDHRGGLVFQKVFSSTSDGDFNIAVRVAANLHRDSDFRFKLRRSVSRAMSYLLGVVGRKQLLARGRLREFRFLLIALDRLEAP